MRKQNTRPNQNARKQMQDLTAELFSGAIDKKSMRRKTQLTRTPSSSRPNQETVVVQIVRPPPVEEPVEQPEQIALEEVEVQEPEAETEQVVEQEHHNEEESPSINVMDLLIPPVPASISLPTLQPIIQSNSSNFEGGGFSRFTPLETSDFYSTSYVNRNTSPFDVATKLPDKMPNPFANRKRFPMDNFETNTNNNNNLNKPRYLDPKTFCEDFSNLNINKFSNIPANRRNENNNFMLPAWWKTRSFSSASCYYPQNVKAQLQTRSLTTMNVPSHGNLDDIDNYLTTNYQQNHKVDMMAKKERWARMKAKKRILRRPVEEEFFEDADEEEEIMCGRGVLLNQIVQLNGSGQYEDADILRKYRRDVAYIKEQLMKEVEGNIDGIREIRFLIASVQTYGNIDGQCMMAEIAMNEFTLFSGVLERFHAIVGPWSTENETQRRRASRQAFDTHKIPLQHNFATMTKKKLVEEILGRSEPSIAYRQGVKVGLYSDTCDEQFRVHLHLKNGFKDASMMVDSNERRFVLVLQSEVELMVESMKHLGKTIGLHYEGFPTTPDRFIIVEAFVDAVVDLIGDKIGPETMHWFALLGQKNQTDTATPWEKNVDLHCSHHTEPKNNYCAQLTVCRATFIILHILGSFFRRYHLRKIPATSTAASSAILTR